MQGDILMMFLMLGLVRLVLEVTSFLCNDLREYS